MVFREKPNLKQTTLSHQQADQLPGFFYTGGGRSKILNQIHHCLQFSPGIIALTGPTGSGRSSVIQALVESLKDNEADLCLLSEESVVLETEEELYRALAEGFGLEQKSIEMLEDLIDRVLHFIQLGLQNKRTMLIIVDDVRQHSETVLDVLLKLLADAKGMTLVVSGEPSLVEVLKHFHSKALLVHQITLRPLLTEEAFEFLHQLLLKQGISDESVLNRKTVDILMSKTGGNLSLLVREAGDLISGSRTRIGRSRAYLPIAHMIAFVVVVVITILAFLYYPASRQSTSDNVLSKNNMIDSGARREISPGISSTDHVKLIAKNDITHEIQNVDRNVLLGSTLSNDAAQHSTDAGMLLHAPLKSTPSEESVYTQQEKELLGRPLGNVTLQVLSLSSEQAVHALIEQATAADRMALTYYRRGTKDKSSYVVLYGDYTNRQEAVEAQKMLPTLLKKSAPWPRPVADVQRELRRRE